jgi:nitronate monooxygenase
MRTAAAQQGNPDFLSLWAGQGVAKARAMPAAELVNLLVAEMSLTSDSAAGAGRHLPKPDGSRNKA